MKLQRKMAGLYVHIPFCKQACSYCNFHFSTSLDGIEAMVQAIIKEMNMRKNYLQELDITSIYFGGGTPSLLNGFQLEKIFKAIDSNFTLAESSEITLEANPDDLNDSKLMILADSPVNRLSIGVQSFRDQDLTFMHRSHNAQQALTCIENSLKFGFENLNVDLIYGVPGLSDEDWLANLTHLENMQVPHWSCYALTIEPKTLLSHLIMKKRAAPPEDEVMEKQFYILTEFASAKGYDHYEISNIGKPNNLAKHNVNYWKQRPYLGLGPSAHSFNGESRSWNVANNAHYLRTIESDNLPSTTEILTADQIYNEYVMTGLRTKWGCHSDHLNLLGSHYLIHFIKHLIPFEGRGWVVKNNETYTLTTPGKLFADHIASELFIV